MVAKFEAFKLKKAGDVKIITLMIDGSEVVIEKEYPKSTNWDDFMKTELKNDSPRYVLLDYDYVTKDGRPADKIILVCWRAAASSSAAAAAAPRVPRKRAAAFRRARPLSSQGPRHLQNQDEDDVLGHQGGRQERSPRHRGQPERAPPASGSGTAAARGRGPRDARAGATQRSPRSQATDHSECTSDEILALCTRI